MATPTAFLPRLPSSLDTFSASAISQHLARLTKLYGEATANKIATDSGYSSEVEDDDIDGEDEHAPDDLRAKVEGDVFERAWSKDWLLALIKRADNWTQQSAVSEEERKERGQCVEQAVGLVAALSKISDSSSMIRQIPLPTATGSIDVTLYDALPSPSDPTSVGLQTWGAAILLGRRMATDPASFGIDRYSRVCELGAGSGLLSIAWAKIAESLQQPVEVVATDYHEDVLANLARNIKTNDLSQETIVEAYKLDWEAVHASTSFARTARIDTSVSLPFPFDEPFDSIAAADVIYGPKHAMWIKSCVEQFLAKPSPGNTPTFHLMVPLRPTHKAAIATIDDVFPRFESVDESYEGVVVRRMEEIERVKGIGRADEQGYRLYEIVWRS